MEFIWLLAGMVSGAAITALVLLTKNGGRVPRQDWESLQQQFSQVHTEKVRLDEAARIIQLRIVQAEQQLQDEYKRNTDTMGKLASAEADLRNVKEKLSVQQEEIATLHKQLTEQFENIASRIIHNNSQMMQEQHKMRLDEILSPLKEKIEKFENKVDQTHKENIRDNQSLKEQLQQLQKLNQTIGDEAKNLTTALKGQAKKQGNWGEFILESILEKSGLVRDREYYIQVSHTTEDGRRVQPDVIISLPDNKSLVIDAKVSLVAYERFSSAENDQDLLVARAEHLNSIKKHIKDLGSKNYQQLYQLKSLDFVILFIPIEPAFQLAVHTDMNLFQEAYEKNIVLVSPSTLLATVRTVASIWRQENQTRNAIEIARQSGALYDKFVGFLEDMNALGERLKRTQDSWDSAMKKLEGRDSLIVKSEKIRTLGARTSKSIPQKNRDNVEEELPGEEEETDQLPIL